MRLVLRTLEEKTAKTVSSCCQPTYLPACFVTGGGVQGGRMQTKNKVYVNSLSYTFPRCGLQME
jgi:hypothetical protein